jgi:hypothetical protein
MVADSCGQGSELQGFFGEFIYYLNKDQLAKWHSSGVAIGDL